MSSSGPEVNNRNYFNNRIDNGVLCQDNDVNINKEIIIESEDISSSNVWKIRPAIQNDEKPDLLENNSRISDLVSCELEIQNQLPDITTSVRASNHGANNSQVDSISNSLDLISSASGTLLPIIGIEGTSGNLSSLEVVGTETVEEVHDSDSPLTEEVDSQILSTEITPKDSLLLIHTEERFDSITTVKEEPDTCFESAVEVPLNEQNTTSDCSIRSQSEFDAQNTNSNLYQQEQTQLVSGVGGSSYLEGYDETTDITQYFDSQKLIGFSADSDVSESDLEEYLKELEELDKTLEAEQESSRMQSIKSMECDRTVMLSECKALNETTEEIKSTDALKSESVYPSNKKTFGTENVEREVESCVGITPNYIKEELSDPAREELNKRDSLPSVIKSDFEPVATTIQQAISQNPFELSKTENAISPKIVQVKSGTVEVTPKASNLDKPAPKSTNPFEEDDVDGEIDSEGKSINSPEEDYQEYSISSIEDKETIQNQSNSDHEINTINQVRENTVSIDESEVSVSSLNKFTAEPNTPEFDLNTTTTEESTIRHSTDDESGSTPVIKSDSSLENLPSCSGSLEGSVRMIPIKSASESPSTDNVDEAGVVADEERPPRPNSLELVQKITVEATSPQSPERPTGK